MNLLSKKLTIIIGILLFFVSILQAQKSIISKVEPANWWVGMKNPNLQLLIYGTKISEYEIEIKSDYVSVVKINKVDNPNYLFIDLEIKPDAKSGKFNIKFLKNKKEIDTYAYELKSRTPRKRGFDQSDLIYLVMPDRFSNGNPANDNISEMKEKANRSDKDGRHGGDIQGIINHLDYIQSLGITALWVNPTLENNMPKYSYHGYAITDFYKTDPRHGTNEDYKRLSDELHKRNMKIIMDMVFNHCGLEHYWIKDLPSKDWINHFSEFTRTNYRASIVMDPHASDYDRTIQANGWFDTSMPDLNQKNRFLATYLIQNSIWWVEYADLDGIRMDTQPYPDQEMMSNWAKAVMTEYHDFRILGEAWEQKEAITAYFQGQSFTADGYNSNIQSVTDFPVFNALNQSFNENDSWTDGIARLYYTLAQDFLYHNANENVIFLDNHDVTRFATSIKSDIRKYKMGLGVLLTTRGIPVIYYGTELMMTGDAIHHGFIREDFPGGWAGDKTNAFSREGRTKEQNEAFDYMQKLAKFRNRCKALHHGKLKHFIPENNLYIYFRYDDNECVMIIINNHETEAKSFNTGKYRECIGERMFAKDVITGTNYTNLAVLEVPPKSITILELLK